MLHIPKGNMLHANMEVMDAKHDKVQKINRAKGRPREKVTAFLMS